MLLIGSCIVEYIPEADEKPELIIIEGTITDQPEANKIILSRSTPLWTKKTTTRLTGCKVWISDDLGQTSYLRETSVGIYMTDTSEFRGEVGRTYTLHITLSPVNGGINYESLPVRMKPVPPIDSIYYEKYINNIRDLAVEGCNIFLSTNDVSGNCNFYRWKFTETWEFHLPFDVEHKVCWITNEYNDIFIKSTSALSENRITRYPLLSISDPVDRLSVKYSLLVKQYSMNEEEFMYWEGFKSILDQTGGLYDQVPAYVPNNLFCLEHPEEKVLGYFSVSAVSSKRLFIKDTFAGMDSRYQYERCINDSDTIYGIAPLPVLNDTAWVLFDYSDHNPPYYVFTYKRSCGDCRTRGTDIRPDFWDEDEKQITK